MALLPKGDPTPEDIRAEFGFVAKIANAVPEINDLLQRAIKEQWTSARFTMSVADSKWFQGIGEFERTWMMKRLGDPAQAEVEYRAGGEEIKALAATLGIESGILDDENARMIWLQSNLRGLKDQAARTFAVQQIIDRVNTGPNLGGRYGEVINEMYKTAFDYGYSSSNLDAEILETAKYMMRTSGATVSTEGWTTKMKDYASRYYAPFSEAIRGGQTVAELAKPAMDKVADLLELPPGAVGMQDPLMKRAMTSYNDKGQAMSLREIEDATRADSRWQTTRNAREGAAAMVNEIGKRFGMIGGN